MAYRYGLRYLGPSDILEVGPDVLVAGGGPVALDNGTIETLLASPWLGEFEKVKMEDYPDLVPDKVPVVTTFAGTAVEFWRPPSPAAAAEAARAPTHPGTPLTPHAEPTPAPAAPAEGN